MTSRSKNIIERLKRTLFKYDMEIARVEAEIALAQEKMDLTCQSTRQKDVKEFLSAKIDKENYEVFISRLKTNKTTLLRNIYLIIDKYEGDYSEVFKKHFFENKEVEQIAEETQLPIYTVCQIIKRLNYDVSDYLGHVREKKEEGN